MKYLFLIFVLYINTKLTNHIKILFIFLFIITLFFPSCKRETISPVDVGYDYYPSNVGHWVTYEVDSTYYDDFTHTVKAYKFKVTEKIESSFLDNQNRKTERLERYRQWADSTSWFLKDVWISNLTSSSAEKVEENIRYIKLVFPIKKGISWNGNAFNSFNPTDYKYENIFKPYTINGISYDSTITVIQEIDSNLIYVKYMVEVYAKRVGLIYKKYKDIEKYPDPTIDSIISGVDVTYKVISFGN